MKTWVERERRTGHAFDYRRHLGDRAATNLAGVFPREPSQDALDLLGYVGVKALWFDEDMVELRGQVTLGGDR